MDFLRYFQSYNDYFWEWDNQILSDDSVFESITIQNGQTIGYEVFIFEIIEFLSEEGLPPFGSLLLAIVATNPESEAALNTIEDFAKGKNIVTAFPQSQSFRVGGSIDFLKLLSNLPEEFKTGEKRMRLFQTIFHECHNRTSATNAKNLLEEYQNYRHHLVRASVKDEFNEANFRKDFRTLALLKGKFPTVQSIINAMEAIPHEDLNEQLKKEVVEDKNLSDDVTDFIDQLIQEDKTFHVGSLIKRLWSGLNIPLHHSHPSEQPLGGISDLTNKGDFDKLVISEFAYDDDVFMSRIANCEALYIQREVPPEADKFKRILLIDNTLKNWGNPKILAFASAIAIARHPKTDIECEVYVVGQEFKEIAVTNVNEVISALSELSGKLDCSAGIDSFFLENKINSKNQEVFLFSSEESLKLTSMQRVMNTYFSEIKYVFSIGMQNINVYKNQNKGRKMLHQMVLPLEELWERKKVEVKRTAKIIAGDRLPLLYPIERFYYNIFHDGNIFYQCVGRTLFMFSPNEEYNKALKKITSNSALLGKGEFALKTTYERERILLNYYYFDGLHTISFLNVDTNELKTQKTDGANLPQKTLSAFESHGQFYFTDNISFWSLQDDFEVKPMKEENIKVVYDQYVQKRTGFIRYYKASKIKYDIVKRLETISIDKDEMNINGYCLRSLKFEKNNYRFRPEGIIVLKARVNLILKNKGTSVLELVKIIKNNTDKDLKECKEIVDHELGIILNNAAKDIAELLKKKIEATGAVCYIESAFFESEDGSTITSKDGVLIFESSDTRIEKFYIPFVLNVQTTMVSADEFAGNEYFISKEYRQENITPELFAEKYLHPFIQNILNHGA